MLDLDDLRFDSLDRCLDSLATLATGDDLKLQSAALSLLAEVAPRALEAPLTALATNADHDGTVSSHALRALHRMGAALPPRAYRRLLGDAAAALEKKQTFATLGAIDPIDVALAATAPELLALCLAWAEGIAPETVPRLLGGLSRREDEAPAELREVLLSRWIAELPEKPDGGEIELAYGFAATHAGALDLLERHWRPRVLDGDATVASAIKRCPALAARLRDVPALHELLREALVAPTGSLVDALGEIAVARKLRNAVLRWSARQLPPCDDHDPTLYDRYWRALGHLGAWEHGAVVLAHLVQETTLASEVADQVFAVWLRRDRDAARAWTERRVRSESSPEERARLVFRVSRDARSEDQAFFERMLDTRDDTVRRWSLVALDRFCEGERWMSSLRALSTVGGSVGEIARRGLARRGDPEAVERLVALIEDDATDAGTRDDALRLLAARSETVRARRSLFERWLAGGEVGSAGLLAGRIADALIAAFGADTRDALLRAYLSTSRYEVEEGLRGAILRGGLLDA